MGFNHPLLNTLYHIVDEDNHDSNNKNKSEQARSYVRDAKAMATTPADVKEYPHSYVFVVDMPGLKSGDIKVQVEEDNVLVVCGERKREEEKEGVKYVRMERKLGKFMRKFVLPENANLENINAVCQDGVLSVTVEKLPPPEPKKPKTVEVVGGDASPVARSKKCDTITIGEALEGTTLLEVNKPVEKGDAAAIQAAKARATGAAK
ncbi:17.3 kDa class II heat shock protein-like [Heracleum sosnowskyi]|uniref:17.3 kDa class II heat shock protein-like n=1 Tax=Heracleum sosnowskyi TaxID=360622 RepID=A0AAD8H4Z2_9APIA|nr:17.3 kDa class II heat shock protein-like [Heracleum sosnowskyi]